MRAAVERLRFEEAFVLQALLAQEAALDDQGFMAGPALPPPPGLAGQTLGAYTLERFAAPPAALDGVALAAGMRVLVKDQTLAAQNGIYVVGAPAWSRAPTFDGVSERACHVNRVP